MSQPVDRGTAGMKRLFTCGSAVIVVTPFVLFGALIPTLVARRDRERAEDCLSNLRAVAKAIRMYAADSDGHLPKAAGWMDSAMPYSKAISQYRCTAFPPANPSPFGYAFNSALAERPLKSVDSPGQIPLVYDSSDPARNAADPFRSLPKPPRHGRWGNNVSFVDGQAKAMRRNGND